MTKEKTRNIISDKLVIEKTGKTIEEWFKILDKKGAKNLKHEEIFNLVSSLDGLKSLGQWNQNLLTTTYEWNRGLKERGQRNDGFEISVSKTIEVPASRIFDYWNEESLRSKWLTEKKFIIRKATENKSLVITWKDDSTVRVELYKKSDAKSQVVVQHMKISDSKTAERAKDYWSKNLEILKTILEN